MDRYETTVEATPARAQSVHSDVLMPLMWSVGAGVLLGIGVLVLALWQGWASPAKWALGVMLATIIAAYFTISAQVRESWWSRREQTQAPMQIPDAQEPATRIIDRPVLLRRREGAPAKAPAFTFAEFVRACEAGGTAEDRWIPVLGETTFYAWRDRLIDAGWAKWRNQEHRHGWTLDAPAKEILAAIDTGEDGDLYESVMDWVWR